MHVCNRRVFAVTVALAIASLGLSTHASAQVIQEVKKYPSPFLIAAAGQSPDAIMVKIVSERNKLEFKYKPMADAVDLEGNKTLLLVMGVSMKGLGAAGIKLDEEMARVDRTIAQSRKMGIPVIGLFAGGAGGRGGRDNYTDEVLRRVVPKVDYLVIVKSGDSDGFIKGLSEKNKIPLTYFNTIVDMTKVVLQIFK
jgi:hypothetical protein